MGRNGHCLPPHYNLRGLLDNEWVEVTAACCYHAAVWLVVSDARLGMRARGIMLAMNRIMIGFLCCSIGAAAAESADGWAFIVGVGYYEHSATIKNIPNCVNDAKALHELLITATDNFKPDQCVLLKGGEDRHVTRDQVLSELRAMTARMPRDAFLLVYLATHGIVVNDRLYLCTWETINTFEDIPSTSIAYRELKDIIEAAPTKRTLILLDACHAGAGRSAQPMNSAMVEEASPTTPTNILMAACQEKQVASEMPDKPHGVFTWFLLEGLRGRADEAGNRDGWVSYLELEDYVTDASHRLGFQENRIAQTPRRMGKLLGDFPVSQVSEKIGKASLHADTPAANREPAALAPTVLLQGGSFDAGSDAAAIEQVVADWRETEEKTIRDETVQQVRQMLASSESRRTVTVTPFHMAIEPVCRAAFAEFIAETGLVIPAGDAAYLRENAPSAPITNISYRDADAYCRWLSKKSGLNYRLPTEDEWEYAAKGGSATIYPWGNSWDPEGLAASMATPNSYGLAQMFGHIYQFCAPSGDGSIPIRGGSAQERDAIKRITFRAALRSESVEPHTVRADIGFRVVCE